MILFTLFESVADIYQAKMMKRRPRLELEENRFRNRNNGEKKLENEEEGMVEGGGACASK